MQGLISASSAKAVRSSHRTLACYDCSNVHPSVRLAGICEQEFSAEPTSKKRRLCQYHGPEPAVEEIEGEFWRIVETPDEVSAA